MTRYDNGIESGMLLCQALGLDSHTVTAIDIVWRPHELPYARVEMLLNEGVVHEIIRLAPVSSNDGSRA